jgi:AcrR family transcriptional regulator
MDKRAQDVAATRQDIVEAAVRLHGSVGPAATTVSAVAQEAGVTRLTVYRHFPDAEALFAACSAHWGRSQTYPDVAAWLALRDPADRLRFALADLYRFYAEGEPMLTRIHRDVAALPATIRERNAAAEEAQREALLAAFTTIRGGARRRRLTAVLGHAVSFWTWRSLCLDGGLSQREAVDAMTTLVLTTVDVPAGMTAERTGQVSPARRRARPSPREQ